MDVYVVSNVWAREGSAIVGAAADPKAAEEIADRVSVWRWEPWIGGRDSCERNSVPEPGSTWPGMRQQIVRVPLAGAPDPAPIGLPDIPYSRAADGFRVFADLARAARSIPALDTMHVGKGAAYDYLKAALRKIGSGLPTTLAMHRFTGMEVLVTSEIPPDEIRIGPIVYVIGTAGGVVQEGQMVRIDTSGMVVPCVDAT